MKLYLLVLLVTSLYFYCIKGEISTSVSKLCSLLIDELNTLQNIEKYLKEKYEYEEEINLIRRIREQIPTEYFDDTDYNISSCIHGENKVSEFIKNPVNAYALIKRTSNDWVKVFSLKYKHPSINISNFIKLPDKNELYYIKIGLYKLSKIYQLDPALIVTGVFSNHWLNITKNRTIVPRQLSLADIYEIGTISHHYKDHEKTVAWMKLAVNMIRSNLDKYSSLDFLFSVLEHLSYSQLQLGWYDSGYTNLLLMQKIQPSNLKIAQTIKYYNSTVNRPSVQAEWSKEYLDNLLNVEQNLNSVKQLFSQLKLNRSTFPTFEAALSERLCRDGHLWPINKTMENKLICYVVKGKAHFYKFISVNVEQIHIHPDIFIFRGIIDDESIAFLKERAASNLELGINLDSTTGLTLDFNSINAQRHWVTNSTQPDIQTIRNKIHVATGFKLVNTKYLEIVNYGTCGYHSPHFDFTERSSPYYPYEFENNHGPRLATVRFYLSNVEIGGRTTFPRLGLSISPSKGDAIFWYNLHPDLTGDARIIHSICPIVIGNHWVANMYIRSNGEENSRPCDLQRQDGL